LYRLEQIFARHGLHIPRTTQWDWVRDSADLLLAIVLAMKRLILASAQIHTDDTYIPIQDKSRTQVREGYLWPHIDMANKCFDYPHAAEARADVQEYQGTPGRASMAWPGRKGKATEVGCWAHARRNDEAKRRSSGPTRCWPDRAVVHH
jgi:hypothetical protein